MSLSRSQPKFKFPNPFIYLDIPKFHWMLFSPFQSLPLTSNVPTVGWLMEISYLFNVIHKACSCLTDPTEQKCLGNTIEHIFLSLTTHMNLHMNPGFWCDRPTQCRCIIQFPVLQVVTIMTTLFNLIQSENLNWRMRICFIMMRDV